VTAIAAKQPVRRAQISWRNLQNADTPPFLTAYLRQGGW
jgi:hypothetical protein